MKLNLRAVDLNLLTVFEALLRERNMSRVAEQLGMSQPAVSAALQRLRLTMKDELFVRSRSGMQPTPRALAAQPAVAEALSLIAEALTVEQQFDPATASREFAVLADGSLEITELGSVLHALQAAGPALRLRNEVLERQDVGQVLARLDYDAVIDFVRVESDKICAAPLGEQELVVIARVGHPRINAELSAAQYFAEGHILLRQRSRYRSQLELALGGERLRRRVDVQVQHFAAMPAVVSQTESLATMPRRLAEQFAAVYPIQVLPFPLSQLAVPIWLMWPASLGGDAGHRWFIDLLRRRVFSSV
ncbi:LysR substrate-binding domain-containing protein [Spongiibacter sp.]|uniref:LysR substrate-binding domain-containing protein n=1 Tax=Spongiibacter sp. TaxID=2024860 RepID=UPI003564FF56